MKLGTVTKLDKRNIWRHDRQIVTSMFFFQFTANLQPYGSLIPNPWSIKLTFSLTITFYLTKTENRTKNSIHSSHTIVLSKGTTFAKKC